MNKYLQNYSYDINGTILAGGTNVTTSTSVGFLRGKFYIEKIVISNYIVDNTNALGIPGFLRIIIRNGLSASNFGTILPGASSSSSVALTYTCNFGLYVNTGFQINPGDQLFFNCRWFLNTAAVNDTVCYAYINLVGDQIN